MRVPAILIAAAFLGSIVPGRAQESPGPTRPAVYKVEFDVHQGGAPDAQANQHFSMLIDESRTGVFTAANRVPLPAGSPPYADVGATIECSVRVVDGKAALDGVIELSAITGQVILGAITQPIIGQRKLAFHGAVELGKPTTVVDKLVEATVTRVN